MARSPSTILSLVGFQSSPSISLKGTHRLSTVVGQDELDARSVNVRNRDDAGTKARGTILPLDTIVEQLVSLKKSRSLDNKLV